MSIREETVKKIFPNHAYEFITGALNKKIAIGLFSSYRAAVGKFVQRIILIRSRSPIKKQSEYRFSNVVFITLQFYNTLLTSEFKYASLFVSKS